jgi:phage minor structural protein
MKSFNLNYQNTNFAVECEFYLKKTSDGNQLLTFELPTLHEHYPKIKLENQISYKNAPFNIKSIEENGKNATIQTELDLDFLKSIVYGNFTATNSSLTSVFDTISEVGNFYYIDYSSPLPRQNIDIKDTTILGVMQECAKLYNVVYKIDSINTEVKIYSPKKLTPSSTYVTEELNLRQVDYRGDTFDFYTRIYPYGKDNLDITSVNGGVAYLNNNQYSNKIISKIWRDERYTLASNLKENALLELAKYSKPIESYELDIIDLAKMKTEYSAFAIDVNQIITFLNPKTKMSSNYFVTEYVDYPNAPEKNKITIISI